jgi:putative endonuclease
VPPAASQLRRFPFAVILSEAEGSLGSSIPAARMSAQRQSCVYIMTNVNCTTLYTGVTANLELRVWQHRNGTHEGFTKRYNLGRLVWFEIFRDISNAIAREKQIKGWRREKKLALIKRQNPDWRDLAADW